MNIVLDRLAHFSYRRRWLVLGLWVFALVGMSVIGNLFAGPTSMDFKLPASDSQRAFELLKQAGTGDDQAAGKVVFAAADVTDPAIQAQIAATLAKVADQPHVASVESPFDQSNPFASRQVSKDGTVAYATL